ncbi:hypothetical protein GGR51DRAFT_539418, partial [Nemania sp. FL0031]
MGFFIICLTLSCLAPSIIHPRIDIPGKQTGQRTQQLHLVMSMIMKYMLGNTLGGYTSSVSYSRMESMRFPPSMLTLQLLAVSNAVEFQILCHNSNDLDSYTTPHAHFLIPHTLVVTTGATRPTSTIGPMSARSFMEL